jgi:hypothetical protein
VVSGTRCEHLVRIGDHVNKETEPWPGVVQTYRHWELAVDKVLETFGRAEARDFVDLAAVELKYNFERLCEPAAEKNRGFSPRVFGEMLHRFDLLQRREFGSFTSAS